MYYVAMQHVYKKGSFDPEAKQGPTAENEFVQPATQLSRWFVAEGY